jgi:hypothetical protein
MKLRRLFAAQSVLLTLGVLTLAVALVFTAAQPVAAATRANNAFVRVVHASPGAGTVDVFVDGGKLLSDFAFGTVTGYVNLPAGSHEIKVAPAGKGAGSAVITQTVSVEAGVPYTVAAIGTTSTGFSLAAFADNNLLSGAMAKVRVYHLSPDAGPVNVAVGGKTVISGLTYKNSSGYLTVPGGAYTFDVTATTSGTKVPVAATLTGGMVYSVFAVGLLSGTPAISFKLAAVAAVPGMPNTGSDPNAAPANQPSNPWFPGAIAIALLLIGSSVVARRFALARQK